MFDLLFEYRGAVSACSLFVGLVLILLGVLRGVLNDSDQETHGIWLKFIVVGSILAALGVFLMFVQIS